jgi:cyclophilin family peptidyl-prolyl cis-trans isomerase
MTKTKKILTALLTLTLCLLFFIGCSDKNGNGSEDNQNGGNGEQTNVSEKPANTDIPESDAGEANYVIINVRDFGEITIRLYPEYAPLTVERFVENVRSGFYTGRNFHRVASDFMIQGGSFDGRGGGDPTVQGVFTETHPDARHFYGALALAANNAGFGSDSFYIVNSRNTDAFELYVSEIIDALEHYEAILEGFLENEQGLAAEYGQEMFDMNVTELRRIINLIQEELDGISDEVRARYAEVGGASFLDGGYTVFGYTIDGFDVIEAISAVETVHAPGGIDRQPTLPVEEIIIEWIIVKTSLD